MEIEDDIAYDGKSFHIVYSDADNFDDLPRELVKQHYGVCFCGDKIVVGWQPDGGQWSLLGGKIELGETFDETLIREVQEESNMRVLRQLPLGHQKVIKQDGSFIYQIRSVCRVEPIGDFVSDPSGGVTKIELIDALRWDDYIDWGDVGRRILQRALELKDQVDATPEGS